MTFDDFFLHATKVAPYAYQSRLASADRFAELIHVPTGAGKTAAVVLGWIWRRRFDEASRAATPRRLVYCLPMRALVEQTRNAAVGWLDRLGMLPEEDRRGSDGHPPDPDAADPVGGWAARHGDDRRRIAVHLLMGGEEPGDWDLHPERDAILIGTQDMLLSRALNRGYAASRFHWPIDFGLLNNDCLWVFDEPQLMGSGVSTSAQLAGLRSSLKTFGPCPSVWMSATLEPSWLDTVDFVGRSRAEPLELTAADYDPERPLHKRMTATKVLQHLGVSASKDAKEAARLIVREHHLQGTQTLVILNTVDRAKAVYEAIKKDKAAPKVLLIHSRFRPAEREGLNAELMKPAVDRIIVATQVVEAGVDLSVRTLITELAPWSSLVQRIGRCNRTGDDGPGRVFWIDLDTDKMANPYQSDDLKAARGWLADLEGRDVSPKSLDDFKREKKIPLRFEHTHVLRRRDLLDLFDTTPDLSGNDIDVSRFVRGDEKDSDVQVFWRKFGPGGPGNDEPRPIRRELCNVRVGAIKDFLLKEKKGKKPIGYVWDHLDREWRRISDPKREVHPGQVILLSSEVGGYSTDLGWHEDAAGAVTPANEGPGLAPDSSEDDRDSCGPEFTIAQHTQHVCTEIDRILETLVDLPGGWPGHLKRAARWHDAGKAHQVFQEGIRRANPSLNAKTFWAKSGTNSRLSYCRKYFRHELASALAALQHGLPFEVAYLIAAHHGKIRLSIRSLPGEVQPEGNDVLYALGVHGGDFLPEVELGGETCPSTPLDLSPMLLGGETSWTARALALRDAFGPFRLAYLESLLRSADRRASRTERKGGPK